LLRRADQAVLAALNVLAIAAIAGYWAAHSWQQPMLEIERAEPLEARFLVDINAADWAEISQIPGIGPTLARRIVDTRQQNGPFADHEQLRKVQGIGPRTLERMKPFLLPTPDQGNVAGP
jgi:competence protein ComEA